MMSTGLQAERATQAEQAMHTMHARMLELQKACNEERKRTLDITADMTRQYKAMKDDLTSKIHALKDDLLVKGDQIGTYAVQPCCLRAGVLPAFLNGCALAANVSSEPQTPNGSSARRWSERRTWRLLGETPR